MSMIYTCTSSQGKQTYEGFCFFCDTRKAFVIGIVPVQGEHDIYILDETNVELAVDELKRMYRTENGEDIDVIVYDRRG